VIYLGLVPSLVAYGTWAIALSRLPASRASNFMYCVPPVATLLGFLWLGEVPTMLGAVGGAMALVGVAVVNWRREGKPLPSGR
jgi:drug/metabolite transporter (DMT)-like permease